MEPDTPTFSVRSETNKNKKRVSRTTNYVPITQRHRYDPLPAKLNVYRAEGWKKYADDVVDALGRCDIIAAITQRASSLTQPTFEAVRSALTGARLTSYVPPTEASLAEEYEDLLDGMQLEKGFAFASLIKHHAFTFSTVTQTLQAGVWKHAGVDDHKAVVVIDNPSKSRTDIAAYLSAKVLGVHVNVENDIERKRLATMPVVFAISSQGTPVVFDKSRIVVGPTTLNQFGTFKVVCLLARGTDNKPISLAKHTPDKECIVQFMVLQRVK